jgi:hypothetical protein
MDLSNKSLALLLVAAIVISLGGTLISLNQLSQEEISGLATASGKVNISVTTNASCTIDSNVSFGSAGQVLTPTVLSTNSSNSGSGYADCTTNSACSGMTINNTGNVNVNVTFYSGSGGATFLGTADSDFTYNTYNGTGINSSGYPDPGCKTITPGTWSTVPTAETKICDNLTAADAADMMVIEYNITLYPTTPPGIKTATITVNCAMN